MGKLLCEKMYEVLYYTHYIHTIYSYRNIDSSFLVPYVCEYCEVCVKDILEKNARCIRQIIHMPIRFRVCIVLVKYKVILVTGYYRRQGSQICLHSSNRCDGARWICMRSVKTNCVLLDEWYFSSYVIEKPE